MEFRMNITVEIDQAVDGIVAQRPVPLQIVYQSGRWQAQSQTPPAASDFFETFEEAVVAGAREVMSELQTAGQRDRFLM
jgi:hypothetical protein